MTSRPARCATRAQHGYSLLELAIVAALLALAAVWMASRISNDVQDAGARATGRHLLAVKGAVQQMLAEHFDTLAGYPPPPAGRDDPPPWLQQPMPMELTLSQLAEERAPGMPGYLPAGFPMAPVYGDELRVRIWREGECPGSGCILQALVHTIGPVRAAADVGYSPELVGEIMMATEGFGGHSPAGAPQRIRGAVFNVPNPVGAVPGIVAVSAALDTTMFHQFVRQGDTRAVWLQNSLDVAGTLASRTGLVLDTAVTPGDACDREGMHAASQRQTLAVCLSGVWFELNRYVVTGVVGDLADGASLPAPQCAGGMQPFVRVALQTVDVELGGDRIDVRGTVAGTVSGTGNVSQAGSVAVSGSFAADVYSTDDSRIRITQVAGAPAGVLQITDAARRARAYAIFGCHHV